MKAKWDIETAKTCQIKRLIPDLCKQCRDYLYCKRHDYGRGYMEQLTIWDILPAQKSDFPCDSCVYDINGCCGYDDVKRHCTLGDKYIQRYDISTDARAAEWEKVTCSKAVWVKGLSVVITDDGDMWKVPVNIDRVEVGQYEGHRAEIGLRYCVAGFNDELDIWVAIMWRKYNESEALTNDR